MDGFTRFVDHGRNHMIQWGRITLKISLDLQTFTLAENCGPMVRHGTAQDNFIPRMSIFSRDVKLLFKQTDAGSIDKNLVRLA